MVATKQVNREKLQRARQVLMDESAIPRKRMSRDEAVAKLADAIREAHHKKNYEVKQIVEILKAVGVPVTQKAVRTVLQIKRPRRVNPRPQEPTQ